jgi:hypothetical protein
VFKKFEETMKKLLMMIVIFSISALTSANNGNDGFVTVANFQLWSNTHNSPEIRLMVIGDTYYNPSGCPNPDSYMVTTSLSDKVQDRMYSMLLSALMAKKSVVLRIENNGCQGNRPMIMNVIVQ